MVLFRKVSFFFLLVFFLRFTSNESEISFLLRGFSSVLLKKGSTEDPSISPRTEDERTTSHRTKGLILSTSIPRNKFSHIDSIVAGCWLPRTKAWRIFFFSYSFFARQFFFLKYSVQNFLSKAGIKFGIAPCVCTWPRRIFPIVPHGERAKDGFIVDFLLFFYYREPVVIVVCTFVCVSMNVKSNGRFDRESLTMRKGPFFLLRWYLSNVKGI